MNKSINVISAIVLAIYCFLVMALVYDLSLSSGLSLQAMPYKVEICSGFAIVVFLLGVLRIRRKWQGANDMKRFKSFHFVRHVSRSALNLSLLYSIAEAIFMIALLYFLWDITQLNATYVAPMIIVIGILLTEGIVFAVKIAKGGDSFRIGIDKKAVAYYNREMHILYFTGLTRVEMHQDMINFQYKDDLNIFLPLEIIQPKDRAAFKEALIETIETHVNRPDKRRIYIDDAFRKLGV